MSLIKAVVLKYKRNKELLEKTHSNDIPYLRDSAEVCFMRADSLKHVNRVKSINLVKRSIRELEKVKILMKKYDTNYYNHHSGIDVELKAIESRINNMREFLLDFSEEEIVSSLGENPGDKYFSHAKDLFAKAKLLKNRRRSESVKISYKALDDLSKAFRDYEDKVSGDNLLRLDMLRNMRKEIEEFLEWFTEDEKSMFVHRV